MVTVTPPLEGPCSAWAELADVYACPGCVGGGYDDDLIDANIAIATNLLFRKSGMQWTGPCEETVRPCCTDLLGSYGSDWWASNGYPYVPQLVAGQWYNLGPGGSRCLSYDCGIAVPALDLGFSPVVEVSEVKIDGVALATNQYRIDNWRTLVRTDGLQWPPTQNPLLADTEAGTWSVTFLHGQAPPPEAVRACAELACELTRFCVNDQKCALPLRVTAVTRQGVTYSVASVMDILERGKTGLYFVDLFLDSVNPGGLTRPPRVLSLDLPTPPRRA